MEIEKINNIENLDEYFDYDVILQRMLDRVKTQIDKREGSIIYDALAPAAAELAQMYITLKSNIDLVFVDTSVGTYLDRLCNQIGLERKRATFAIKQGHFYDENNNLFDVNIGEKFTIDNLVYRTIEKISTGIYKMQCEISGKKGNDIIGELIPVNYINNLAKAELTDLLIPGEDEEDDETLRNRYYETTNEKAFAGNISDYKKKTKDINGVGAVKVTPVWNGGGTVKLTILDSKYNKASNVLIEKVQEEICPKLFEGIGIGLAPIGHSVTVDTVEEYEIQLTVNITTTESANIDLVKQQISQEVNDYLLKLRESWENEKNIIIRISQIEARIMNIQSILDINNTTLNSSISNIELHEMEIPILKEVNIV